MKLKIADNGASTAKKRLIECGRRILLQSKTQLRISYLVLGNKLQSRNYGFYAAQIYIPRGI